MRWTLVIGATGLVLSGCASIFSGTTQELEIRTTPGAKYSVTNTYGSQVASGVVGEDAMARMTLVRGAGYFSPHAYRMHVSKSGYRSASVPIDPALNPFYFGNILLGGFVGMIIVDPISGAMYRMVPQRSEVALVADENGVSTVSGATNSAPTKAEQASAVRSQLGPISRHDYTARQHVKAAQCEPEGNPEVTGINTAEEEMLFVCRDGRKLKIVCRSGQGCGEG